MLDSNTIKKIEDFVYLKPRSIQEIAQQIGKNWRTVDRYVREIKENFGTLGTRTFREGTRGALKIVYWASIEKLNSSIFQEKLAEEIKMFKKKEDFSSFDIYQHIPDKEKSATIEHSQKETDTKLNEFKEILEKAQSQVLYFSGNLSWINLKKDKIDIFETLENLVKKNIKIKILCRVDLASISNIERILSLNLKHGKELIEIRHSEQPLRAFIIDNKIMRLKEIKEATGKINELNKKTFIFYTLKNKEWIEWLSKVFWNIFSNSIDSKKRMQELNKIKKL